MIPSIEILAQEITEVTYPTRTYKINFNTDISFVNYASPLAVTSMELTTNDLDRISGYVDDLEAIVQAIYLILMSERYKHIIYSWDYGIELVDLYGKPMPYVMSELPRRITEALTMDDRIDDVKDFEFEVNGKKLHTTFTVVTNIGNISTGVEVTI